jgi:hypothetical protein
VVFETLTVRQDGPVLFAKIAAPPMNLLGPELVRDLVSLIQQAEADDTVSSARVQERRSGVLHFARRRDPARAGGVAETVGYHRRRRVKATDFSFSGCLEE